MGIHVLFLILEEKLLTSHYWASFGFIIYIILRGLLLYPFWWSMNSCLFYYFEFLFHLLRNHYRKFHLKYVYWGRQGGHSSHQQKINRTVFKPVTLLDISQGSSSHFQKSLSLSPGSRWFYFSVTQSSFPSSPLTSYIQFPHLYSCYTILISNLMISLQQTLWSALQQILISFLIFYYSKTNPLA